MTPPERAQYFIKTLGLDKAMDHVLWVYKDCADVKTRKYWESVFKLLEKQKEEVIQK